jgi:hypothetical protein
MDTLVRYPAALALAALAAPIVWAYRRKPCTPRAEVATAALWDRVLDKNTRWNRWLGLRDRASLAVQLTALGLIAAAAAGPKVDWPVSEVLAIAAATLLAAEAWAFHRRWTS